MTDRQEQSQVQQVNNQELMTDRQEQSKVRQVNNRGLVGDRQESKLHKVDNLGLVRSLMLTE